MKQRLVELEETVPGMLFEAVKDQLGRLGGIEADMEDIEVRIKRWQVRRKPAAGWQSPRVWGC